MLIRCALLRHVVLVWLIATQVGCVTTWAPPPLAKLVRTVGAGELKAGGIEIIRGGAQVKAIAGMPLDAGDELRTNAVSRALILFADGTRVIVQPNSTIGISSMSIFKGIIDVWVRVQGKFRTQSELAMVATRSTKYRVEVDENKQTKVDVVEGTTLLTSNTGSWTPVVVPVRERALVKGREAPQKRPLTAEEVSKILDQFRTFNRFFDIFMQQSTFPGPLN